MPSGSISLTTDELGADTHHPLSSLGDDARLVRQPPRQRPPTALPGILNRHAWAGSKPLQSLFEAISKYPSPS